MQLRSSIWGGRTNVVLTSTAGRRTQAPRQLTTCMAKKKGVPCFGVICWIILPFALGFTATLGFPGIRCIVTLECTEARGLGETPTRYTTQKVSRSDSPLVSIASQQFADKSFCAEPEEHAGAVRAEEVQQVLEALHRA